ncbi:MAG: cell division protein ZapB [Desulfovibrionaceae bacterium]
MELLDLLEKRISTLMSELTRLRHENDQLRKQLSDANATCAQQEGEVSTLKEALVQEGQLKDTVLERIEFLLQRLKDLDNIA